MCEYVEISKGKCNITNDICPFLFYCNKEKRYKENQSIYKSCKIKTKVEVPMGYHKVCFERRGNLYISIDGKIEVVANPFNTIPMYVKVTKLKNGKIRLKEYEGSERK